MPILENSQHERFAQELAKGSSSSAAFVAAGYKAHASNASRLSRNDKVQARVEELQRAGAEQAGVTIERLVQGFASIAFNEDAKDTDRISAMEKLGKHLGMFKEGNPAVGVTVEIKNF